VLERYLADLHGEMHESQRQHAHIGTLNSFFHAIRQHRWNSQPPRPNAARQCGARPLGWPWTLRGRVSGGVRPLTASALVVLD
jgi:hypothetical protein